MTADEHDLRAYAHQGDEAAFRRIVDRHAPMVHGVALRMTGDRDLAEEITQNAFSILARKAGAIGHSGIAGWLHTVATSECRNARRKEARRYRLLNEYSGFMKTNISGDDLAWAELRPHLDDAINRLPGDDREIMLLRFFEQRSFREISATTSHSEESCRQKCRRALQRLEKILTRHKTLPAGTTLAALLSSQLLCSPPASAALIASTAIQSASAAGPTLLAKILLHMTTQQILKTTAIVAILAAIPVAVYRKPGPPSGSAAGSRSPSASGGSKPASAGATGDSAIDWQTIATRFGEKDGLAGMIAARKLETRLKQLSAGELAIGLEQVTESGIATGPKMHLRHTIAHILAPLDPMAVLNRFPEDAAKDMGVNLSVGLLELAKKDRSAADAWFAEQVKAGNFSYTYPDGSPKYLGDFQGGILGAVREDDPVDYGRRILALPPEQRGEAIRWSTNDYFNDAAETIGKAGDPAVMSALLDSDFAESTVIINNTEGKSNDAIFRLLDGLPDNAETARIRQKLDAAATRKFKTERF